MIFKTYGNRNNPTILFFHAMGVVGKSSEPVIEYLKDKYYCIAPTSTVYCKGQKYINKEDEIRQVEEFLKKENIDTLELVVASSIGADLAVSFISKTKINIKHVFLDGGQFAQIKKSTRHLMTPFLYLAIKSLYWSKGSTLKKIMWCGYDHIKPYFIEAGEKLTYSNIHRQLNDSLQDKPFPEIPKSIQENTYFEFGSIEDHYKYRDNVINSYPYGNYPVFDGYNHMQYQIENPKDFANMLETIIKENKMPELSFLKKD